MIETNNKTVSELSELLLRVNTKKYGSDYAYAHALGSIRGLVDFSLRYDGGTNLQRDINNAYYRIEKEDA